MKNFHISPKKHLLSGLFFGAALSLTITSMVTNRVSAEPTPTPAPKVQLMFVQTAEDIQIDPARKTLRLVKVTPQTLYFSDRPVRVAGNLTMAAYLDEWKAGAGPDNFANDPPNATLSVYEPGRQDNILAVIEISNPTLEGKDLVYNYRVIEGTLPKAGGATALFIDWIGVGGGVGPGFHGVGVGARGVGVY